MGTTLSLNLKEEVMFFVKVSMQLFILQLKSVKKYYRIWISIK